MQTRLGALNAGRRQFQHRKIGGAGIPRGASYDDWFKWVAWHDARLEIFDQLIREEVRKEIRKLRSK
jgi:hypothetical protein